MEWLKLGGPVMYVIAGCSILVWTVILERLWFFYRFNKKGIHGAIERIVGGVSDSEDKFSIINMRGRKELLAVKKRLTLLYVLGKVLPMLGLLGTVLGMVKVFQQVSLGNIGNPNALASGIWEALLTTVAGLVSAIPAILFHSYFSSLVDRARTSLEEGVIERISGKDA